MSCQLATVKQDTTIVVYLNVINVTIAVKHVQMIYHVIPVTKLIIIELYQQTQIYVNAKTDTFNREIVYSNVLIAIIHVKLAIIRRYVLLALQQDISIQENASVKQNSTMYPKQPYANHATIVVKTVPNLNSVRNAPLKLIEHLIYRLWNAHVYGVILIQTTTNRLANLAMHPVTAAPI